MRASRASPAATSYDSQMQRPGTVEDVRIAVGRSLSRKERAHVRLQLELGLDVSEIVADLKG